MYWVMDSVVLANSFALFFFLEIKLVWCDNEVVGQDMAQQNKTNK